MASLELTRLDWRDRSDPQSGSVLQLLGGLEAFSSISRIKLKRLADGARISKLPRRAETRVTGLFAADIYLLLQGAAKISFIDEHGKPLLTTIISAGAVFGGRYALLPATVHGFHCVCLRNCILVRFDTEELVDALLGTSLTEFAKLQEITIVRWCDQVLRYSGRALRERLAMALLDLAAEFGARDARGMLLTLLVTHDMLADLVGASRQRITLHLNELMRCGAVKRDGRRLILVIDELQRIGRILSGEPPSPFSEAGKQEGKGKIDYRDEVDFSTRRGRGGRGWSRSQIAGKWV